MIGLLVSVFFATELSIEVVLGQQVVGDLHHDDQQWVAALLPPYEAVDEADWDRLNYIPDPELYGFVLRPSETLVAGGGDCEDFAIILYHQYRIEHDRHDMYIVVGWEPTYQDWHAVLYLGDERKALDALSVISPGFSPLFAINEHGVWRAE